MLDDKELDQRVEKERDGRVKRAKELEEADSLNNAIVCLTNDTFLQVVVPSVATFQLKPDGVHKWLEPIMDQIEQLFLQAARTRLNEIVAGWDEGREQTEHHDPESNVGNNKSAQTRGDMWDQAHEFTRMIARQPTGSAAPIQDVNNWIEAARQIVGPQSTTDESPTR
jgi:hypothetical protein